MATIPIHDLLSSAAAGHPSAFLMLLMLLKATCLLVAALTASLAMRRASAGSRHLVWLVVLGALVVLPLLAAWSPLPMRVLPSSFSLENASLPRQRAQPALPSALGTEPSAASARRAPRGVPESSETGNPGRRSWWRVLSDQPRDIGLTLLVVWAAVALVLAGWLAYGAFSVRRIVRRSRPLQGPDWQAPLYEIADRLGLEAAPRLVRSDTVKMPFACGLRQCTIVLPAESDEWSAARRSAVLLHELAHVRRRDLLGHTLGRIVCLLYWFHPLVWTAARRLRAESERACDDLALGLGARPSEYAEHLLDIVTRVRDHAMPSVALAMAHRKEFEGRLLAILNPELRRKSLGAVETGALVGLLALLFVVVSAAAPVARVGAVKKEQAVSPASPIDSAPRTDAFRAGSPPAASSAKAPLAADRSQTLHLSTGATGPIAVPLDSQISVHIAVPEGLHSQELSRSDERPALLAKVLRSDTSASLRRIAAWGLQRYLRINVAFEALTVAVSRDADAPVREMAAWALAGARRNSRAGTALVTALRQDKDPSVRATAVWALGNIGDADAVDALVEVLRDADAELREMAAWSIGSCRPERAPGALLGALSDRDRAVRESAAWALYTIRDADAVSAIEAAMRRETDSDVRQDLVRALGAMGEASVDALTRLVDSQDPEIRRVAISSLAGRGIGPWPWPRPNPRPYP